MSARALRPLLALVLGALLLAAPPGRAQQAVEPPSPQAQAAFAEIAGCLAASDELRVLMVVDESRSLRQTDPDSQRTSAILATLDSLSLLQQDSPAKAVNVAASTFADAYTQRIGWGAAAGGHLADLRSFATDDVPGLNNGTATDYRAAMTGAQRDLSADPAPSCKVMLWFTDGGLDVGDSQSATAAALDEICTTGGIADSLRSNGIHVVSGALFRPDSDLVDDADRATLAQISEGEAKGGSCGTVPVPQRYADGAYVSATDPAQLAALFASLMAQISGFTGSGAIQCPSDACVAGTYPFPIDAGIARMRIIAVPIEGTAPQFSLTDPSGARADLPANQSVPLGDFTVETSQAGNTWQFDADLTRGEPVGQWALDVKSGSALVDLYLLPGLAIALDPGSQQLAANSASQVTLSITGPDGDPVDPAIYGSFTVTGRVDSDEQVEAAADGQRWRLDIPAPAPGALPSTRQLSVSVTAVTKPSGIELDPVVRQFVLPVSLSAYYPTVGAAELVMGPVAGEGRSSGSVPIIGSSEGPTRACIAPLTLSGPHGQDQIQASPQDNCVELEAGGTGELTLATDEFSVSADGTLNGVGQVSLFSTRAQDPQTTLEVPARMVISRPVDEAMRWGLVAALLAASLAIPLALIYLLGRRLARFDTGPAAWVRVVRVPVTLDYDEHEARILRDGAPLRLFADDVAESDPDPPHNKSRWNGRNVTLATDFAFWGTGRLGGATVPTLALRPTARATGTPDRILASSSSPYVLPGGRAAPCELRIERAWYLEFEPGQLHELMVDSDGALPTAGTVRADLIVIRLDSDPGTVGARGEQLAAETVFALRMLQAAAAEAEHLAAQLPEPQPVGAPGSAAPADWLAGPGGPAPKPPQSGEPPTDRPTDPGLPDWLR